MLLKIFNNLDSEERSRIAAEASKATTPKLKKMDVEMAGNLDQALASVPQKSPLNPGLHAKDTPAQLSGVDESLRMRVKDYCPDSEYSLSQFGAGKHQEEFAVRVQAVCAAYKALTPEQIEDMKEKAAEELYKSSGCRRNWPIFALFLKMHGKDYPISQYDGSTPQEKFLMRSEAMTAAYKALTPEQIEEMKQKAAAAGLEKSYPVLKPRNHFAIFRAIHREDYHISQFKGATYQEKLKARNKAMMAAFTALTEEQMVEMNEKAVAVGLDRSKRVRKPQRMSNYAIYLRMHSKDYRHYYTSQSDGIPHDEKLAARWKAMAAGFKALTSVQIEEMKEKATSAGLDKPSRVGKQKRVSSFTVLYGKPYPLLFPLKLQPRKLQRLSNFALFIKMHSKDYPRLRAVSAAYKTLTPEQIAEMRQKAVAEGLDRSKPKKISPEYRKRLLSSYAVFRQLHGKEFLLSQFSGRARRVRITARAQAMAAAFKALPLKQIEKMKKTWAVTCFIFEMYSKDHPVSHFQDRIHDNYLVKHAAANEVKEKAVSCLMFERSNGMDYPISRFPGSTQQERIAARARAMAAAFTALTPKRIANMNQTAAPRLTFENVYGKDYPISQFPGSTEGEREAARARAMAAAFKALTPQKMEKMGETWVATCFFEMYGRDYPILQFDDRRHDNNVVQHAIAKEVKWSVKRVKKKAVSCLMFEKNYGIDYPLSKFPGSTQQEGIAARARSMAASFTALTPKQLEDMKQKAVACSIFEKMYGMDYPISQFPGSTNEERRAARVRAISSAFSAFSPEKIVRMKVDYAKRRPTSKFYEVAGDR